MCFFAFSKLQLHAHIFSLKKMKHDVRFQHMTSIQSPSMRNHPKFPSYFQDGWRVQNGWILEKFRRGGGVAFFNPSKNIFCRFWTFKQSLLSMKFEVKKSATWFSKNGGGGMLFGTFLKCHLFWTRHPSLMERIMLLLNSPPSTAASSGDCLQSACLPLLANEDQKWIKLAHWELRQIKMVSILASICFHTCFLKAVSCLDVEATRVCSCLLYFCCL